MVQKQFQRRRPFRSAAGFGAWGAELTGNGKSFRFTFWRTSQNRRMVPQNAPRLCSPYHHLWLVRSSGGAL